MDFELTGTHKKLGQELGVFCREALAPQAKALDEAPRPQALGILRENLKRLGQQGYLSVLLQDDLVAQCVAGEEVAKACPATHLAALSSLTACGTAIRLYGTTAQKNANLAGLATADLIGAFAMTESDAGSDLASIATRAFPDGDGWTLTGVKTPVTNGPLADRFLVLAWTDRDAGEAQGFTFFLLNRDAPGLSVGEPTETLGMRGAFPADLRLELCRASIDAVLGGRAGIGAGARQLAVVLEYIKLGLATQAVGLGCACMELSTAHAKTRKAFGKPIGLFEGVGAKLAMMYANNDLGRMLTLRAAWAMEQRDPESPVLTACAKLFASEAVNETADLAMQVHGGRGYLRGSAVERLYRDARFTAIAYGTSEMQRAFIARDCLDRFRHS